MLLVLASLHHCTLTARPRASSPLPGYNISCTAKSALLAIFMLHLNPLPHSNLLFSVPLPLQGTQCPGTVRSLLCCCVAMAAAMPALAAHQFKLVMGRKPQWRRTVPTSARGKAKQRLALKFKGAFLLNPFGARHPEPKIGPVKFKLKPGADSPTH